VCAYIGVNIVYVRQSMFAVGCVIVVDKADNKLLPTTADAREANAVLGTGPHVIPVGESSRLQQIIPEDFRYQFETNESLIFKSARTDELDTVSDPVLIEPSDTTCTDSKFAGHRRYRGHYSGS
jgi:hypothetical protein